MSKTTISQLKKLDWNQATATLYITKRRLAGRKAKYNVFQVKIDTGLEKRLIKNARLKVNASNKIQDYDYMTADQDNTLLNIDVSETDFESVIEKISNVNPPDLIQTENDLSLIHI